ncbi:MAG: hypothetical protein ABR567_14405 [Myxococcales bacterium]|nr:hypothetical protein [Myxococcales bacterium]
MNLAAELTRVPPQRADRSRRGERSMPPSSAPHFGGKTPWMTGFLALIASALVGWLTHAAIGDHVGIFGDFAATTFTGGIAYVAAYYYLKKLRG